MSISLALRGFLEVFTEALELGTGGERGTLCFQKCEANMYRYFTDIIDKKINTTKNCEPLIATRVALLIATII